MSDTHWSQMMLPRERIEQLENANIELRQEKARLQSEVERLRGRCGAMEDAIRLAVRAAPSSGPLWFQSEEINQLCNACKGSSDAWLLRKQAEAVEPAIRTALRNLGNADLSEEDIARFAEGYAQRLRQQAAESENGTITRKTD